MVQIDVSEYYDDISLDYCTLDPHLAVRIDGFQFMTTAQLCAILNPPGDKPYPNGDDEIAIRYVLAQRDGWPRKAK